MPGPAINVLAELERCGVRYDWAGADEVRVLCPFHDDSTPTCHINVAKRVFHCPAAGCGEAGDVVTYLARLLKTTRQVLLVDLSKRYKLDADKVIDAALVERYHAGIWKAEPLLAELRKRGVDDDLVRKYRLGVDDGRITIPITNEGGLVVNVRRYLPGAPGSQKMKNSRGHGAIRLWPLDQLKYDSVVVCGGEMKAIVAARELNPHGVGAVTTTGGEGNWEPAFNQHFKDKRVWVCLDVDEEGQIAARDRCNVLYRFAEWVGNVVLPLDHDKYPHGDINDFVALEHGSLWPLLESCPGWELLTRDTQLDDSEPEDVDLTSAMAARFVGKRVKLRAVVAAMDTAPYVVPKKAVVNCTRDQKALCSVCPVFGTEDGSTVDVHPESASVIDMVGTPRGVQREALMLAAGIPLACKVAGFEPTEYYNVEDVRVSPQLEITNRSVERVMQPAMCIGMSMELNEGYELTGRMYPHPKTQQTTLLISKYSPVQDALSTYEPRDLERLRAFQPDEWTEEGIEARLGSIYTDFEANVTRIYQRRDLHLMIDLAYHSPLLLHFDGKTMKGWVEVLVVGDSAQGKTETAVGMMHHYGLGTKAECKNASVAGLLGGLQQMGQRWFVTWGVLPTHDKRLVILEELKGASVEVIAKLTDMRSSGIAEIDKIEKKRTHARTRIVALSNPRSDRQMATYNFGIEAVKELIGNLEDVRRFDAALVVSSSEVDPAVLNTLRSSRPHVPHQYTSELCRSLVLWAWTRTQDEVLFEPEATDMVMRESTRLCDQFTDALPLVDRGSMRNKLARLSASLACRTFSTTEGDLTRVAVRQAHVMYASHWLSRVYNSAHFGYADYTAATRLTQCLVDEQLVLDRVNELPWPTDFAKQCLHTTKIDLTDIQDWCGWDRSESMDLLSFLVRKHAFVRDGRSYRKTPPFIKLLRLATESGKLTDRPQFVREPRKQEF
jgi:hypothetical protein